MKEAPNSPYAKLVFRETFNDESSVRKNGGTPIGVVFSEGRGLFSSTTSARVNYDLRLENRTTAFRFRVNINSFGSNKVLLDLRSSSVSGTLIYIDDTGVVQASGATIYVNGVVGNQLALNTDNEIIFVYSNVTQGTGTNHFVVGANYVNGSNITGFIDLFEIYVGSLTLSQVQGLYKNTWNKDFISSNLLLDYDSTNGYITDRTGKNTLTATDVSIKKTGSFYSADFNGTTSKIDTGSDFIGTKAITVCGWIYNTNSIGYQRILDNSKFRLGLHSTNTVQVTSDQVKFVYSLKTVPFNSWQFISLTRKVDGKISFYLGDKSNSPVLNGSVDLDSGTPTVAASNVFIGSHPSGTTFFYGNIPMLKVYEGILDLETITQIWSSTRGKIQ